jgi:hypothetical protein
MRFTFLAGTNSNILTKCFGGYFWLIKTTKADDTFHPVRAADPPRNSIKAEREMP